MSSTPTPYKRKLIEVALPLEAINVASAREKSIRHGHPSTLHLWWARRPLAACRAVLFASLVDDPSSDPERFPTDKAQEQERQRLFGIIEELVLWENSTNEEVLERARVEIRRSTGGNPPTVLDPFCGGGSIPLEAQRLGLVAYASDLNPVAVLITKALIELPAKFASQPPVHPDARAGVGATGSWKGAAGLAEDVRRYGAWMHDEAERRIGHLYPKVRVPKEHGGGEATVIAWLWARTVTCPNPACGATMPLVRSFALSKKKGKEVWVVPVVDRVARTVAFTLMVGSLSDADRKRLSTGTGLLNDRGAKVQASFACVVCGLGVAKGDYLDREASAGRMGEQLLAVVADGSGGRFYVAPSSDQLSPTAAAAALIAKSDQASKLPNEPARGTFASNAQGRVYGFRQFKDYYTARQLLVMSTLCDLVREVRERVLHDLVAAEADERRSQTGETGTRPPGYADAVATYLGFANSKVADQGSTLVGWFTERMSFRHVFARQGLPMVWDFAEANPLQPGSGGIANAVKWTAESLDAAVPAAVGSVVSQDATSLRVPPGTYAVSTDPPYYDNIGYADLSDYFYVWLRRSLGDIYPDLFATVLTPKAAELVASPFRFDGSRARADQHFENGLGATFARIREVADPRVPFTVYYAFKQSESDGGDSGGPAGVASTGWETMLEGLLHAGYSIDGTWPMRSELSNRVVAKGSNALASSIVLVCRPRPSDAGITTRRDFLASLKGELPRALRELQQGSIAPVDLAQAAIGPGMAVFSRYAKVLEPDGSRMSVRTALGLINGALDEVLEEQENDFDADTRWAVKWYEQHGLGDGKAGDAILLANAKGISLDGLVESGILEARGGAVRLKRREELPADWDPAADSRVPVWEATQHLIRKLTEDGEAGAGELAARLGGMAETAKELAYRLYVLCERQKRTEEALAYNALVVSWPEIVRLASGRPVGPTQTRLRLES